MHYATLSDVPSVARRIFCPVRDRHAALSAPIISVQTLLVAAAIAASVTFGIEWMHTAHGKADSILKAEENCCAFRSVPASVVSLLDSPFAHGNALLFLSEPVGSDVSRQGQASPRETERPSGELIPGNQLPKRAPSDEDVLSVPLPQSRPFVDQYRQVQSGTAPFNGIAPKSTADPSSAASSAFMTFLKNLFGKSRDDSLPPEAVGRTAVYDIEGRVVYLPNGEKLEAHSGLGKWLDDTRYVSEKGRGPTPPNVYRLALRKELFHGVQAIRLNPVGGSNMYGRAGILAHPYMLGPDGQSNGCVSLQDYPKFLEAFLRGDIDRLIVLPSSGAASARAAGDKQYASR
jgi:Protein of unknown function (DUF2778)